MDAFSLIALLLKVSITLFVVFQLHKQKIALVPLILIPFFITGVELSTLSDSPWRHLFSSEASKRDYEIAVLGGAGFLFLPIITFLLLYSNSNEKPEEISKN